MSDLTLMREELENDVLEFLYARLNAVWRPGTRSLDTLTTFLERLARKPADIAHLAIIYHLFRPGGAEQFFINELPEAVHRLSHSTRRARNAGRKIGRGQIVWSETLIRQNAHSDPTVYVVNQAIKEYDTPSNRLLAHYVREVWSELGRIKSSSRGRLADLADTIITNSQEALRSAYLRQARSVTSVTSAMLSTAGRSKHFAYWRAAYLWQELEDLQDPSDIARLRDILRVGWIGPLSDDDLFEVYVLVRVLRALENSLCRGHPEAAEYNLIGQNDWIGKLSGDEWVATVHYDTAPHNAFHPVIGEADYKYKSLLSLYGGMAAAARRPDICVTLERKADNFVLPILVEVKNTSLGSQYGRDSVYKVFGYLADFEKLWMIPETDIRPKAVLVLREDVVANNSAAALLEDVVLISPPNMTERLEEVFAAAMGSSQAA